MKTVASTLKEFEPTFEKLGGDGVAPRVIAQLRGVRTNHLRVFGVLYGATVLILIAALVLAFLRPDLPGGAAAFAGGLGITAGGALEFMRRAWREWAQSSLLIALLEGGSDAEVRVVIEKLASKL